MNALDKKPCHHKSLNLKKRTDGGRHFQNVYECVDCGRRYTILVAGGE